MDSRARTLICLFCSRDTFVGTYAVEYVQQKHRGKWDIRRAVERACKASARTIEVLGAQESIPWADEIDPVKAPTVGSLKAEEVDPRAGFRQSGTAYQRIEEQIEA